MNHDVPHPMTATRSPGRGSFSPSVATRPVARCQQSGWVAISVVVRDDTDIGAPREVAGQNAACGCRGGACGVSVDDRCCSERASNEQRKACGATTVVLSGGCVPSVNGQGVSVS